MSGRGRGKEEMNRQSTEGFQGSESILFDTIMLNTHHYGLPSWLRQLGIHLQCRRPGFYPWVGKIPFRREWQPPPVLLLGEFHGQRSQAGYSPWDHKESDMTEGLTHTHIHTHTSLDICPNPQNVHHQE